MSVSFEALAMAGVDYNECGISMEEWEQSEMTTPPHLLAEEEWERTEMTVPVVFPSFSNTVQESRDKCKGDKKLPPIFMSRVKKINLVKQLSSKTMMIDNILPTVMRCTSSKVQPAEQWNNLFRVLIIEFKRIFSV